MRQKRNARWNYKTTSLHLLVALLNYYVYYIRRCYYVLDGEYDISANVFTELRTRNRFSGDYLTALADRYLVVSRQ